jgi:hypothetical protein
MSEDEVLVLICAGVFALISWSGWLVGCCQARRARASTLVRLIASVLPIACAIILLTVLLLWSSADVRTSGLYTFFYMVFGAAWLGLTKILSPLLGISLRDDVLERRNTAALWPIAGALLGLTFCFAGANIGDGPGWWVVLFAAIISTGAWSLFWLIYESMTHVAEHITIDRDPAAGWRLAGYLTATGIIFGRAVAGDWQSASATIADAFTLGWPALLLLLAAIFIEQIFRPTVERPTASPVLSGYIPALMYLSAAAMWIYSVGPGN